MSRPDSERSSKLAWNVLTLIRKLVPLNGCKVAVMQSATTLVHKVFHALQCVQCSLYTFFSEGLDIDQQHQKLDASVGVTVAAKEVLVSYLCLHHQFQCEAMFVEEVCLILVDCEGQFSSVYN